MMTTIKTVQLGNQGLTVPAVGLGCMGMSEFYGDSDEKKNLALLDQALELGCNFWDTSDMYGPYTNETLLGKALQQRRSKVILASKFGVVRNDKQEWLGVNGRPEYVKASCEASLKRLNTDVIDLYYQHRIDPDVPIEETVGAMANLVKEGKVKYLGLSEASPQTLQRAHNEHPISALQTEYSLWSKDVEAQILPTARQLGIGFVAYSPLGRGFLTGAIKQSADLPANDWRLENPRFQDSALQHNQVLAETINIQAQKLGITPAQLCLAWLMAQGDDIAMIPGTRHASYLKQNWAAQTIKLPENDLQQLNQLSTDFAVEGARY